MTKKSCDGFCPIRHILDRFGDKWSMLVLWTLRERTTVRFGELGRAIPDISPKMLAATLRTLETDGYVARRAYPEVPPRVEYRLTPLGETLMPHIAGLIEWAERPRAAVAAARADDDRRTERTAPATRTAPAGPDTRSDRNP